MLFIRTTDEDGNNPGWMAVRWPQAEHEAAIMRLLGKGLILVCPD